MGVMRLFALVALGLGAGIASAQTVLIGTLSRFNTLADAKLGSASTYARAINFSGGANRVVNGITFESSATASNFTHNATTYLDRFRPELGSSADENAFEAVVGEIGFNGGADVGGTFTNLTPGTYLVKTYFHEEFWSNANRTFDINLNGNLAVTSLTLDGYSENSSHVHEAAVTITGTTLSVTAARGNPGTADGNPTISAVTLQAVPEPMTMTAIGIGLAGLAIKRRRK
jgi:hypothetical protein